MPRPIKRKRETKMVQRKPSRIPRAPKDPFPQTITVTMPYSTSFVLDATSGLAGAQYIRANSINDPEYAVGGHQPYGHDVYSQVYHHYKVLSSSIEVHFGGTTNTSPANPATVVGVSVVADPNSTNDSFHELREQSGTNIAIHATGSLGVTRVTNGYNANIMFSQKADHDDLNATFGANPAEGAYFKVWTTAGVSTYNPPEIVAIVMVKYKVVMWERRDMGQS